jgi:putative toxin-antitoxin system antitoxin component (TIGR02293 family)
MPFCYENTAVGIAKMVERQNFESIKRLAHGLRHRFGVESEHAPNIADILTTLKKLFPKVKIQIVPDSNLPIAEALADWRTQTILLKESLFGALENADARARFTVAHELGHLFLRHEGARYRATTKRFVFAVERQQEWEAHIFAAEFLAPAHLVSQYKSADEIAQRFQVSLELAKLRLEELSNDKFRTHGSSNAGASDFLVLEPVSKDDVPIAPTFRAQAGALVGLTEQGYSEEEIFKLVIPKRTLARRHATDDLLTVDETDKALRLKRIAAQAQRTFGDPEKAHRWLRKSKRELRGEAPLAYLATEAGARVVEEMLYRIEHGIVA